MRKLLGTLTLGLCLLAGGAHADDHFARLYYGLGVSDGTVEVAGGPDKGVSSASATLGVQLLDFFGLELQGGYASDQVGSMLSEPLLDYQGLMGRLGHRWDRTGVYVLFGQARIQTHHGLEEIGATNVLGGGINLFGNESTSLNFQFLDFDGEFSTATIGFQHYLGGFR